MRSINASRSPRRARSQAQAASHAGTTLGFASLHAAHSLCDAQAFWARWPSSVRHECHFREQGRTTRTIDDEQERPIWNHDEIIRNNVLAINRDAQVWGGFDVDDGRHWPASLQDAAENKKGRESTTRAAAKLQKADTVVPAGLSLEKLAIRVENNVYDARPWQGLFHWGVEWKRHKLYSTPAIVRAELGIERGSRAAEFIVADSRSRDFRVPADSPALDLDCYPNGEVPGVKLGRVPVR